MDPETSSYEVQQLGFPELSYETALSRMRTVIERARGTDLLAVRKNDLTSLQGMSDPPGEYDRVDLDVISKVQREVREVCDTHGFPIAMTAAPDKNAFDAALGTVIFKYVQVPELLAAREGMWRYLSTLVLPEVALWRYHRRPLNAVNTQRYLGHPDRDVLRSRWWRAWSLGPDLTEVPAGRTPLGEDEYTSIMERPTIGYSRELAQGVRDCIWRWEPLTSKQRVSRPLFTRALTRLLILDLHSIDYSGFSREHLAAALDELAEHALTMASTGHTPAEDYF